MKRWALGPFGGKNLDSGRFWCYCWEDLVVLDAAVFRVGWLITKMGAENLSRASVSGWVEPGAEDRTHCFTVF